MPYVATVNIPGYLPIDDEPPVFETAAEAWEYLASEVERDEDYAYVLADPEDPEGPAHQSETLHELEARAEGIVNGSHWGEAREGTVYGPTPGCDGDHDLGLAYSVTYTDEMPEEV